MSVRACSHLPAASTLADQPHFHVCFPTASLLAQHGDAASAFFDSLLVCVCCCFFFDASSSQISLAAVCRDDFITLAVFDGRGGVNPTVRLALVGNETLPRQRSCCAGRGSPTSWQLLLLSFASPGALSASIFPTGWARKLRPPPPLPSDRRRRGGNFFYL